MSNYTEADVERMAEVVETGLQPLHNTSRSALRDLKAAALEGAKVPGLVADNAALLEDFQAWVKRTSHHDRVTFVKEAVRRNPRGTALLAEHAREVSTLQARVAELDGDIRRVLQLLTLGQQVDGTQTVVGHEAANAARRVMADRDALRAQVVELEQAVLARAEAHKRTSLTLRVALSTPPAETTPATARKSRNDEGTIGPALLPGDRCAYGNTCVCGECADPDEQ